MRDPGLEIIFPKEIEIGTDHVPKRVNAFCIRHDTMEESGVVMAQDIIATRFVKIFGLLGPVQGDVLDTRKDHRRFWRSRHCGSGDQR